jgi:hypothetical protein
MSDQTGNNDVKEATGEAPVAADKPEVADDAVKAEAATSETAKAKAEQPEAAGEEAEEAENAEAASISKPSSVPPPASAEHAPAHAEPHGAAHEEHPPAEEDRLNVGGLAGAVVATVVLITALVIGVNELFTGIIEGEISEKVLEHQSADLRELRATEQDRLTHYRWVDQKQGVVRIPLDRAIRLTLEDYRRPPAPRLPPPDPAKPAESAPAKDDKATSDKGPKDAKGDTKAPGVKIEKPGTTDKIPAPKPEKKP